jgi:hypothetical protein
VHFATCSGIHLTRSTAFIKNIPLSLNGAIHLSVATLIRVSILKSGRLASQKMGVLNIKYALNVNPNII